MTVREIIKEWLLINIYDGLAGDECGCTIEDLAPCDECLNLEKCEAGYVYYCDDCPKEVQDKCNVEGCPRDGGFCVSIKKDLKIHESKEAH